MAAAEYSFAQQQQQQQQHHQVGRTTTTNRKRKAAAMHPRNKYAENAPDFNLLACKYPTFKSFVSYGANKRPRIDWTDFNATRELTRVLLDHDYGIKWWIPDGQLCPTVTSRANYIHWIEDLLASCPAPWNQNGKHEEVCGIDIGTGANCIYPLLGTALHKWHFVATDITAVALVWAQKNIQSNPSVADLIKVRSALIDDAVTNWDTNTAARNSDTSGEEIPHHSTPISDALQLQAPSSACLDNTDEEVPGVVLQESQCILLPSPTEQEVMGSEDNGQGGYAPAVATEEESCSSLVDSEEVQPCSYATTTTTTTTTTASQKLFYPLQPGGPPIMEEKGAVSSSEAVLNTEYTAILVGVVKEGERFDFCMCNPPFFTNMAEANANPRTACGGTAAEMIYPGGEEAFVARMIEDSTTLKHRVHWYTTMVGRKVSLKVLTAKLWTLGVAAVRTTEFVQGRTSRWGLAWSFTIPPKTESSKTSIQIKSNISFMLEGLRHGCSAVDVLQALISQLQLNGVSCTLDLSSFSINGVLSNRSNEQVSADDPLPAHRMKDSTKEFEEQQSSCLANATGAADHSLLRASVFQQAPGSLLIKASLGKGASFESGKLFMKIFEDAEQALKEQFNLKQRRTK